MHIKKWFYIIVGCFGIGMGVLGSVLPVLPTTPFLLLSAYCFARSSQRLHRWLIQTKWYQKHLQSYVRGEGMTVRTKAYIITMVSVVMGVGFLMMEEIPMGRAVLALVWVVHILYFVCGVKTIS